MAGERRYFTRKQVRKRYGNCSDMTIYRWERDPQLGFPQPFQPRPGGPNLYDGDQLDEFDERRRREALAGPERPLPPRARRRENGERPEPPAAA